MTRIVIVDDHVIVRRGLNEILAESPDLVIVSECSNGQELIRLMGNELFDLVLLDISLPGRNGLDILKQVKTMKPQLSVLVMTMHPEEQYAIRALKAGASGYITKDSAPDELLLAIRKVSQGGRYISASLAEKLAFSLGDAGGKHLHELLSDREYQILCLIASGKTVSGISADLALSVKTVSTYRTRILEKMRMSNNAELSNYAIKNGLVL